MLTHLAIRNLALIDELELSFANGLTVLTGETGAGKSLLMDALSLALGARADAGLIRHGQSVCEVSATFHCPQPTAPFLSLLEEQGLSLEDDTCVLRRQLKADAPSSADAPSTGAKNKTAASKAWVNGIPVSANVLAAMAEHLVDIHSQHATQQLFKTSHQRDLLDTLAGLMPQRGQLAQAYTTWHNLNQQCQHVQQNIQTLQQNAENNAAWLAELDTLNYQENEEEDLLQKRQRANQLQGLQHSLSMADDALSGDSGSLAALRTAGRALMNASKMDESFANVCDQVYQLIDQLEDTAHTLASQTASLAGEGLDIEKIDDRLHALRAAARKHRVEVFQLPQVQQQLAQSASQLAQLNQQFSQLQKQTTQAQQHCHTALEALNSGRQQAYPQLEHALTEALRLLHLPHARLVIQQTPLASLSAAGSHGVELLFSANPGQPPQPLTKVASGGELSRAMLALKSVLFQALSPRTVVLDEVDTGLSGPTAAGIGKAMARLAKKHQVLAITHHPQVAAAAKQHLFISKTVIAAPSVTLPEQSVTLLAPSDNTFSPKTSQNSLTLATDNQSNQQHTVTRITPLPPPLRLEELARLLAGSRITPEARAAAESLLIENQEINDYRIA